MFTRLRHALTPQPVACADEPRVRRASRPRTPLGATPAQMRRARALAITRDMNPGVVSTRLERDTAVQQLIRNATRDEAREVIAILATRPFLQAWRERTPEFKARHAAQVARLEGRPAVAPGDPYSLDWYRARRGWTPAPTRRRKVRAARRDRMNAADAALYDLIVHGYRRQRVTAREVREWAESRVTVDDPDWGRITVGEWA